MSDIITLNKHSGDEMTNRRRAFSLVFKLEAAGLCLAAAMNVVRK